MEEVTMAAKALYESLSVEEMSEIQALFNSIDIDGDGKISISEFTSFMEGEGAGYYSRSFFNLLDHSGDGFLQLDELYTFAYIRASGRPWCDACGVLILGLYFTCTKCRLTNQDNTFDLCVPCYRAKSFLDLHPNSEFADNYTLLLKMQHLLSSQPQGTPGAAGYPSSSTPAAVVYPSSSTPAAVVYPSSSTGIDEDSVLVAFKALVEVVIPGVTSLFQS